MDLTPSLPRKEETDMGWERGQGRKDGTFHSFRVSPAGDANVLLGAKQLHVSPRVSRDSGGRMELIPFFS